MKIDLDDLERKASAATPGPWTTLGAQGRIPEYCRGFGIVKAGDGEWVADAYDNTLFTDDQCLANARHIAATSPPVTLALIARIRELETALGHCISGTLSYSCRTIEGERRLIDLLEKGTVLP